MTEKEIGRRAVERFLREAIEQQIEDVTNKVFDQCWRNALQQKKTLMEVRLVATTTTYNPPKPTLREDFHNDN
jgi:hypothetical protein